MRDYAPWRLRWYCSECMRSVWFLRIEREGKMFYECQGNPKHGERGCGHRLDLLDGKDKPREDS